MSSFIVWMGGCGGSDIELILGCVFAVFRGIVVLFMVIRLYYVGSVDWVVFAEMIPEFR